MMRTHRQCRCYDGYAYEKIAALEARVKMLKDERDKLKAENAAAHKKFNDHLILEIRKEKYLTGEIDRLKADVARLVEAAEEVDEYLNVFFSQFYEDGSPIDKSVNQFKAALAAFKDFHEQENQASAETRSSETAE